jgi:hypothetical protein
MSKTIKNITPCKIKPKKKNKPKIFIRRLQGWNLGSSIVESQKCFTLPAHGSMNQHRKKKWTHKKKVKKIKLKLRWAPRSSKQNRAWRFQFWRLEPSLPIDASMKTRLKNIETTLRSLPSSISSDPSLHVRVMLQMRNKNASSSPDNHYALKSFS